MTLRVHPSKRSITSACLVVVLLSACNSASVAPPSKASRIVISGLSGGREAQSEISIIDENGGNRRQLSDGPGDEFSPVWSPDRSRIAFSRREVLSASPLIERESIILIDPDGSQEKTLIDDAGGIAWSPDGQSIVFGRGQDLWLADSDGSSQRLFLRSAFAPSWSRDGRSLVIVRGEPPQTDLWVVRADGKDLTLVKGTAGAADPDWGPDGDIAFVHNSDEDIASEIRRANPLSGAITPMVKSDSWGAVDPAWSPDGRALAFVRVEEAPADEIDIGRISQIWVWRGDSAGLEQVTQGPSDSSPDW